MGEDNDDEDLVARVDALSSKVVTATTTASTALSMVYDCNEACAQMEQSAAHGPNAKLGDRVTQLERKIDNVFEKLTHFEDRYLDIMQVLRSIQGTLLPVGGQAIARPYGPTVEMQVNEEIQTELKERLRLGPTTQQSVPFVDNSATGQVVDYQSSAPIPTTPDNVTNPMYTAPNSAEGAAAPVGTETIWSEHDAAKGQQLDLSSVRSTIVPSIQLIPPTPNNSQEQASYSTIMIVDGTPMEPIPISVQSAQLPAETTSSKLYPAIGNVDGWSEEKNGPTNIGPVASQQTDGVSDLTGLTATQPTFPPPLTLGPNTIGHKKVPGESSTSGANILDIIVSEQHNPVSDPTKLVAAEPILCTLLTSGPKDTDSFISHPSPALDSSCSTTVNPTQVTSPTSGPHALSSDIPQPAPSSLLVIPSASLLAPPLVHD
ncbi:hypothetical protein CVT25_010612 [Psilocybe cyanescens]|uniref:Uncharacterized protein n=1 Tax=Psilocybe cyanescens TaxID=93625 RepID=A0A409XVA0_PSICY|nr:hypothetical protein CVT25_010612 [Psilocybe cyanescens]